MIRISPYRTTPEPGAMVSFLETLGLSVVLTHASSGFALMRADAGLVGIHPGSRVETTLALAVDDLAELDGIEGLIVWDEAYGRHGGLLDPTGGGIWIDEDQADLHGYLPGPNSPRAGLAVTAVRYSTDFAADQAFFGRLGLVPTTPGDEWWLALRAGDRSGTLGLHRNQGEPLTLPAPGDPLGAKSLCGLGFTTTEPLEQVRDRLVAAGHVAEICQADGLRLVRVVDPDGQPLQIHCA